MGDPPAGDVFPPFTGPRRRPRRPKRGRPARDILDRWGMLTGGATALVAIAGALLLSCAAPQKKPQPPTQPKPSPTAPATPPPVTTPPPIVDDGTTCEADWPDATDFRFGGRPKRAGEPQGVWFFWYTAVTKWDGCERYMTDPRQFGTCAYHQEGHPRRGDCERKHGVPVLFGAPQRADNPWTADADFGTPVVACLKKSCADPSRQETCSVCRPWTVGQ